MAISWHNFWGHLTTINKHKMLVMKHCFKIGLYKQGLLHDLSKYAPSEFWVGVKYYRGTGSPNSAERRDKGYSIAWLHHKGRNKHHIEYWMDYSPLDGVMGFVGIEMPYKYVAEMLCDRMAACKTYNGKNYTQSDPYDYFMHNYREQSIIHPKTREAILELLEMLRDKGEEETFRYLRKRLKTIK